MGFFRKEPTSINWYLIKDCRYIIFKSGYFFELPALSKSSSEYCH